VQFSRVVAPFIGQKVGMTRVFTQMVCGEAVPGTGLLRSPIAQVVAIVPRTRTVCVFQLGAGSRKIIMWARPSRGHYFALPGGSPSGSLQSCVSTKGLIPVGAEITADHFVVGPWSTSPVLDWPSFAGGIKKKRVGNCAGPARIPRRLRSSQSLDWFDTGGRQDLGKTFRTRRCRAIWGVETRVTTLISRSLQTDVYSRFDPWLREPYPAQWR